MVDFQRKASLLGWAVQQGVMMVIIQVALGMECVGMLEHELVCGEREEIEEQRQEKQRRPQKRQKEMERQKAPFEKDVRGGMYTHVWKARRFKTGTRALDKLSWTPSYIYIGIYIL